MAGHGSGMAIVRPPGMDRTNHGLDGVRPDTSLRQSQQARDLTVWTRLLCIICRLPRLTWPCPRDKAPAPAGNGRSRGDGAWPDRSRPVGSNLVKTNYPTIGFQPDAVSLRQSFNPAWVSCSARRACCLGFPTGALKQPRGDSRADGIEAASTDAAIVSKTGATMDLSMRSAPEAVPRGDSELAEVTSLAGIGYTAATIWEYQA